jgi:hypothetical protein
MGSGPWRSMPWLMPPIGAMRNGPALPCRPMPDVPATRSEAAAILRAAIQRTGLSVSQYAARVLVRESRTVRRWLAGELQIPRAVLDRLKEGGSS